jgi:hypothetical protein
MRAPRRSHRPAGHCRLSDDSGLGEHEYQAHDRKRTNDSHLPGSAEIAQYQWNVFYIGSDPAPELVFGRAPSHSAQVTEP